MKIISRFSIIFAGLALLVAAGTLKGSALRLFEGSGGIGAAGKPGSVQYNASQKTCLVTGGGEPQPIDTGFAIQCNNDYGLSSDGRQLAISGQSQEEGKSIIYVLPSSGGTPRRVTAKGPSYWHGWSPDGKWIVFLSYDKEVKGHPANQDVMLRLMPVNGGEIRVLAKLFGGQGTINVPSWSPDSSLASDGGGPPSLPRPLVLDPLRILPAHPRH
jgi:dipeptidyl aminopeptidase/acylaminoacyl peptidase